MTETRDLDAALRTLDPTSATDTGHSHRAAADLQRILATDPTAPAPQATASPRRPALTARRAAVAALLVAAATTALLVLPPVLGGSSAFATWTAYPTGLSPEQGATAVAECRTRLTEHRAHVRGIDEAAVAISERRGQWTNVVFTGRDGYFGSCLSTSPQDANYSAGSSDGGRLPGPRELTIRTGGTATMDAGDASVLAGFAGDDVATVTYPSEDHGDVVATVDAGAWALWFPGDGLEDQVGDPSGVDVRVGYRDGSTAVITLLGRCNRGLSEELC